MVKKKHITDLSCFISPAHKTTVGIVPALHTMALCFKMQDKHNTIGHITRIFHTNNAI